MHHTHATATRPSTANWASLRLLNMKNPPWNFGGGCSPADLDPILTHVARQEKHLFRRISPRPTPGRRPNAAGIASLPEALRASGDFRPPCRRTTPAARFGLGAGSGQTTAAGRSFPAACATPSTGLPAVGAV